MHQKDTASHPTNHFTIFAPGAVALQNRITVSGFYSFGLKYILGSAETGLC